METMQLLKVETDIHQDDEFVGGDEEVPLRQRVKILLARNQQQPESGQSKKLKMSPRGSTGIKTNLVGEGSCPQQGDSLSYSGFCTVREGEKGTFSHKQSFAHRVSTIAAACPMSENQVDSHTVQLRSKVANSCHYGGLPGGCNGNETQDSGAICSSQVAHPKAEGDVGQEKIDTNTNNPSQHPSLSASPIGIKVEFSENNLLSPYGEGVHDSDHAVLEPCNVKNGSLDEITTIELDHIPLLERRRMLLLTLCSSMSYADRAPKRKAAEVPTNEISVDSGKVQLLPQVCSSCHYGVLPGNCNGKEAQANDAIGSSQITYLGVEGDVARERIDMNTCNPSQHLTPSNFPIKSEVQFSEDNVISPKHASSHAVRVCDAKNESQDEIGNDELDHIPLRECHRMLLLANCSSMRQSIATSKEVHIAGLTEVSSVGRFAYTQTNAQKVEETSHSTDIQCSMTGPANFGSSKSNCNVAGPSCTALHYSSKASNFHENISNPTNFHGTQANGSSDSSQTVLTQCGSPIGWEPVSASANNIAGSALRTLLVKKEVETVENGLDSPSENAMDISSNVNNLVAVKSELGISDASSNDETDHMSLRQRRELLIVRNGLNLDSPRNLKCLRKTVPSAPECNPTVSRNAKPEGVNYRRKRKRTATDSVETALEEDVPGLLQVLIAKGIMVDEIKLYGDLENDDALDGSFDEENFVDLETVVSKLFSQRSSLLKYARVRCTKGSKPSYCLGCLISLVEQARYLQFVKWPVEWGWCRDLQAFIFVFERHHRIVLERPEYGYATYFFELVESLPIDWQIRRLVTAMKLTSCSRASLIENKSLLVGEDLTEGEAKVLEEYGWTPNTGLGSMLNYCDRVIHDRKNERDGSEWRSKIGKLLTDGFNGGTIVLTNIPKKVGGYKNAPSPQVNVEP